MATLRLWILISILWIVASKEVVKQATTVTPDRSTGAISINEINVEVETNGDTSAWKFETTDPEINDEGQQGFDLEAIIGSKHAFNRNRVSSIRITINGSTETPNECDMFLVFADADTDIEQYFATAVRLDSKDSVTVSPRCGKAMESDDPEDVVDGTSIRWNRLGLLSNDATQLTDSLGDWPIIVTIVNDPLNQEAIFYYSVYAECGYSSSFSANTGLKMYIAGDGTLARDNNLKSEIFYIDSIKVETLYCDTEAEWDITYTNGGIFFQDPCNIFGSTSLSLELESIMEYVSAEDTSGTNKIYFANAYGDWTTSDIYGEGDDAISARINKYTFNSIGLVLEIVLFSEGSSVNGREVAKGTLKYSIELDNTKYVTASGDDSTVMVCVSIAVNGESEDLTEEYIDAYEFTLGTTRNEETFNIFKIYNEDSATCTVNEDITTIGVTAKRNGNLVCYTFARCDGVLLYDPFVYYEGDDADSKGIRHDQFGFAMIGFIIIMIYNT